MVLFIKYNRYEMLPASYPTIAVIIELTFSHAFFQYCRVLQSPVSVQVPLLVLSSQHVLQQQFLHPLLLSLYREGGQRNLQRNALVNSLLVLSIV
jgi:hypothetical protein